MSDMSIIEIHNLTKAFDGIKAVDSVTVEFTEAKITGLVGPNGAGKTTILNLINGFLKPDKGEIYFKDKRTDGKPPWEITNLGIGRLFQDVRVFKKLTVLENVLLARINNPGELPLKLIFSLSKIKRVEKENMEEARHWIDFVGLGGREDSPAESLSFGQQKLLAIARLLAGKHVVLLLDEPTAGVNPMMVKPLLELIRKLVEADRTVIFIEHNMNVVLEIADWLYFLNEGKVTSFGLPSDVLGDPEVRRTYLGI